MEVPVQGFVAAGFEPVREVFADNFATDVEVGASFSAVCSGVTVVDLWGGYQDLEESIPWRESTMSVTGNSAPMSGTGRARE